QRSRLPQYSRRGDRAMISPEMRYVALCVFLPRLPEGIHRDHAHVGVRPAPDRVPLLRRQAGDADGGSILRGDFEEELIAGPALRAAPNLRTPQEGCAPRVRERQ